MIMCEGVARLSSNRRAIVLLYTVVARGRGAAMQYPDQRVHPLIFDSFRRLFKPLRSVVGNGLCGNGIVRVVLYTSGDVRPDLVIILVQIYCIRMVYVYRCLSFSMSRKLMILLLVMFAIHI